MPIYTFREFLPSVTLLTTFDSKTKHFRHLYGDFEVMGITKGKFLLFLLKAIWDHPFYLTDSQQRQNTPKYFIKLITVDELGH